MDLEYEMNITLQSRLNMIKIMEPFNNSQINKIPSPFRNNLIWNLGHVIVTQQLLTYGLSNLPMSIPIEDINRFRKGTKPEGLESTEEIDKWKSLASSTLEEFKKDYKSGLFKSYKSYSTSYQVSIHSIDQAITFNNAHEAMHLGTCLGILKHLQ